MISKLIFILSLVFLLCPVLHAEEHRYYDVEIVVFESLQKTNNRTESWPQKASVEQPKSFVELGLPFTGELPEAALPEYSFVPLEDEDYKLKAEVKLLDKSISYRVLMHLAWRQPGLSEETAVPVRIERLIPPLARESQAEERPTGAIQNASDASLPGTDPTAYLQESIPAKPHRLEGFVKIILSRYLHIHADLGYQEENPLRSWDFSAEGSNSEHTSPPFYHLLQTRRMRSNELHYLDHPVLGVLVLITPFGISEPETASPLNPS